MIPHAIRDYIQKSNDKEDKALGNDNRLKQSVKIMERLAVRSLAALMPKHGRKTACAHS